MTNEYTPLEAAEIEKELTKLARQCVTRKGNCKRDWWSLNAGEDFMNLMNPEIFLAQVATIEARDKEIAALRAQMPVVARVAARMWTEHHEMLLDGYETTEPDFADIMAQVEQEMKTE